MLIKKITTSSEETQELGEISAKEILKLSSENLPNEGAIVLGLRGNLGGGKTTFLQGFAKGLGIKESVLSPTYVIYKKFKIPKKTTHYSLLTTNFSDFYHFDCYRLKDENDVFELGFKEIISNPKNIVAIEWPEKIRKTLPKEIIYLDFKVVDEDTREISFKM